MKGVENNSEQGNFSCCMPHILGKRDGKIVYNRTIKANTQTRFTGATAKIQIDITSMPIKVFQQLCLPQYSIFPPFSCGLEATVK
jgi:hypothetical protein